MSIRYNVKPFTVCQEFANSSKLQFVVDISGRRYMLPVSVKFFDPVHQCICGPVGMGHSLACQEMRRKIAAVESRPIAYSTEPSHRPAVCPVSLTRMLDALGAVMV